MELEGQTIGKINKGLIESLIINDTSIDWVPFNIMVHCGDNTMEVTQAL